MIEAVVFYTLAAILLGMGLLVITRTNPMAAALAMVGAFAALAGLYTTLSAGFLAAVQVLVYAGGIMVLMIFVIMLLNLGPEDLKPMRAKGTVVLAALLGGLTVAFGSFFLAGSPVSIGTGAALPQGFGSIALLGEKLFSTYLFPFEMLSLLLLAAVVGALVLAKKKL